MADSDVSVRFGADTSGVQTGATSVKGALAGIQEAVASVGATFKGLGELGLASMERVTLGASSARTAVVELGEAASAAKALVSGIGEAMLAVFAVDAIGNFVKGIAEFSNKMAESAEATQHAAITFGLTTDEVQRLQGQATAAGVPFDALTSGMMRLDRAMGSAKEGSKQQSDAFKKLGIDINEPMTQTQLFSAALEAFGNMADGPAKVDLEMSVFGRNIQGIAPLLAETADKQAEVNKAIQDYGVVNSVAEQKGLALAEATNTNKLAMMGLRNVLEDAFAPVLTEVVNEINQLIKAFLDSYNSGGVAKKAIDMVVGALKGLADQTEREILADAAMVDVWNSGWTALSDTATLGATAIEGTLKGLAEVASDSSKAVHDAMTGNFAGAAADVKEAGADMVGSLHTFQAGAAAVGSAVGGDMTDLKNKIAALKTEYQSITNGKLPSLPGEGQGTTGDDPTKQPKGKDADATKTQMEAWADTLQHYEDAAVAATGQANANMQAGEIEFWAGKLKTAQVNSDLYFAILEKLDPLVAAQDAERVREASEADKKLLESRIKAVDGMAAAAAKGAKEDLEVAKAANAEQLAALKDQLELGEISQTGYWARVEALQQGAARHEADAGEQAIATAQRVYAARLAIEGLSLDAAIAADDQYVASVSNAATQISVTWANMFREMSADQTAQMKTFKSQWDGVINPMVSNFNKGLLDMAQGTKSFAQEWKAFGNELLGDSIQVVDKIVEKFLWGTVAQTLAQKLGITQQVAATQAGATTQVAISGMAALKQVTNSAAKAAGEAYSALAGIPVIGPALGAGAAVVTFAAVEAFGAMVASAAGGYDIPAGVNPITQLHAEEMVLPARLANPIRDMADGVNSQGSSGANSDGGGSGGGDIHLHVHAVDGDSVLKMFRNHKASVAKGLREMARGGVNTGFAPA